MPLKVISMYGYGSSCPSHDDGVVPYRQFFRKGIYVEGDAVFSQNVAIAFGQARTLNVDYLTVRGVPIEQTMEQVTKKAIDATKAAPPLVPPQPLFTFPGIHTTKMCELLLAHYFSATPFVKQLQSLLVPWIAQQTSYLSAACELPANQFVGLLFGSLPEGKVLIDNPTCPLGLRELEKKIKENKHVTTLHDVVRILIGAYGCLQSTIAVFIPAEQADDDFKAILTTRLTDALYAMWRDVPTNIIIDKN